jgi:hypothetical protein
MACPWIKVSFEDTARASVECDDTEPECVEEILFVMRNVDDRVVGPIDDEGCTASRIKCVEYGRPFSEKTQRPVGSTLAHNRRAIPVAVGAVDVATSGQQ